MINVVLIICLILVLCFSLFPPYPSRVLWLALIGFTQMLTKDISPSMSLWPLGVFPSLLRILTFLPMRLSVMRLPQSSGAPSMMMLFSISVLPMVAWPPMTAGPLMVVPLWMMGLPLRSTCTLLYLCVAPREFMRPRALYINY